MKAAPIIAFAEDNPADVYLVRSALEEAGLDFQLHVLSDGEQALRYLETAEGDAGKCPAIVLLDLNLPKVSGIDILSKLREGNLCSSAAVVVITSSDSARDRDRVAKLAVEHYFLKTASLEDFMKLGAVVREVLEKRQDRG